MFSVGVVLLALERTGSAALAGALVAAITFPSIFTAPLLGAWLDLRGRRKALMMLDQAVASVALVSIALGVGRAPDVVMVLIALVAGVMWPLSFGGYTSLIPTLVPEDLLPPANALEATSLNVGLIAGPVLAGLIAAGFGPEAAVLTEAGLTAGTLVLLAGFTALDTPPSGDAGASLVGIARAGVGSLVRVPQLLGATVAGGLSLVGIGFLAVTFPLFCVEHLDADSSGAGGLWAAFAVGSTIGALALVRAQRRFRPEWIVMVSLLAFGVLMLPWSLAESLPLAAVLVGVAALTDGPVMAGTFAVRQAWAPRELQGQIFTTAAGVHVGCFAIGSGIAGPLVESVGSATMLVLAAALQFGAALLGALVLRLRGAVGGRRAVAP